MSQYEIDTAIGCQLIVVAVLGKYMARILLTNPAQPSNTSTATASYNLTELRKRVFFLAEHILFSLLGFYSILYLPGSSSWYFNPKRCWDFPPTFPSLEFHLFYIAKLGTHVEDVLYRVSEMVGKARPIRQTTAIINGNSGYGADDGYQQVASGRADIMMDIHHFATASLCVLSYCSGYYKIGSLLMLIHDVSDVPLDVLRVFMAIDWQVPMYCSYIATLAAWVYFRLWILAVVILRTVVMDPTTSFIFPCDNAVHDPNCVTLFYAEMGVYVVLIGALWVLHVIWFCKMILKGYRLIVDRK